MEKNLDNKRRWRSRTVGFRVSEEEGKLLDNLVVCPDYQSRITY